MAASARPDLAVVIPVYQGADLLAELVGELVPALERITPRFDVLFVDDGSTDASWARIAEAAARDSRLRGLRLIRNFGEHVAITAGLDAVDATYAVIMACDLQDDPAAIERLLAKAREGVDLVLVRRMERQDGWLKRLLARIFYGLISLLFNIDYDYRVGNFRLLTAQALAYFKEHRERSRNVNAIMALMGVRTGYIDVVHRPRRRGRSTYTLGRSARMALGVIVGYSQIPLLVSGLIGAVMVLAALAWGLAMGTGAAAATGTAAVLCGIGFTGGLMLLNLGIVGAYLGRAATEAKVRPLYFVSGRTEDS